MSKDTRDFYGDILKAIGIIMIVMGHCWSPTVRFVYTCHLALFFLVMGMYFSEFKYSRAPFQMLGQRMKNLWPKYVFYLCIFVLFHNIFINIGFYPQTSVRYTYGTMLIKILNSFTFSTGEQMGGAMWFVYMYLIGTAFMGGLFYLANKLIKNNEPLRYMFLGLLSAILGGIGLLLNIRGLSLSFHFQTTLLLMPVAFVGFLLSLNKDKYLKWVTWYGAIFCCSFIWFMIDRLGMRIELAAEKIGSMWAFYPITFTGLYVCLWLAKTFNRIKIIKPAMAAIGRASFDIMALHFLVFKVIDFVYIKINNLPMSLLSGFPISFPQLGPLYVVLGVVVPVLISLSWNYLKTKADIWYKQLLNKKICPSLEEDEIKNPSAGHVLTDEA